MELASTDESFLSTARSWLEASGELFAVIRHPGAGGAKDYVFFRSFDEMCEKLRSCIQRTSIIFFKNPQLKIRGLVDDDFIQHIRNEFQDGQEFLVVCLANPRVHRPATSGDELDELTSDLMKRKGESVAVGPMPAWWENNVDIVEVLVPDSDGITRRSAY